MNKKKQMFSLWITHRSHLFVIEKMAQLIDFKQILTYFYLDLNALWTANAERKHIISWLTCQSGLPWSSRKQASYLCTDSEIRKPKIKSYLFNASWDICFQPLGRKDGPRILLTSGAIAIGRTQLSPVSSMPSSLRVEWPYLLPCWDFPS